MSMPSANCSTTASDPLGARRHCPAARSLELSARIARSAEVGRPLASAGPEAPRSQCSSGHLMSGALPCQYGWRGSKRFMPLRMTSPFLSMGRAFALESKESTTANPFKGFGSNFQVPGMTGTITTGV